jgi:hypothetical protein
MDDWCKRASQSLHLIRGELSCYDSLKQNPDAGCTPTTSTKCTSDLAAMSAENACTLWSGSHKLIAESVNISSAVVDDGGKEASLFCSGTSDEVRSKRTSGCVRTGTRSSPKVLSDAAVFSGVVRTLLVCDVVIKIEYPRSVTLSLRAQEASAYVRASMSPVSK